MADKANDKAANSAKNSDQEVTNPKYSEFDAPQMGGVSSQAADNEQGIFKTEGNQPVRDRQADPSKGTPVTRFFTKEGTPVEPSNLPGYTPSNLAGPDPDKMRDDVVTAVEYIDEGGNTVTHDSLKTKQEADKKSNK